MSDTWRRPLTFEQFENGTAERDNKPPNYDSGGPVAASPAPEPLTVTLLGRTRGEISQDGEA